MAHHCLLLRRGGVLHRHLPTRGFLGGPSLTPTADERCRHNRQSRCKCLAIPPQADGAPFGPEWLDHALMGGWADHRECHVGGDFLLIYWLDSAGTGGQDISRLMTYISGRLYVRKQPKLSKKPPKSDKNDRKSMRNRGGRLKGATSEQTKSPALT
ncbi:type II toxin-antitoxin system mRNA interferase toxin, RelE/StbE family [Cupriavidus basilensis]|uniref:type II toxin-antitoxin system mRNA interferase toxin, RelE/StbE family n=1 Tax=Cupriavidus basilensis TaxID=68895 RepID=UPI00240F0340|nr:type II toxin-antitoxin system mRNA interferase toxin, RelE/StbE family [Cupriavidus basilensis]